MLEIKNINKSFKKSNEIISVLKDFSLTVENGEFIAFKGTSGCGKSTLLLTIGAMLMPDSGEINFNEKNVYNLNKNERNKFRAEKIGFIFQQFHLMPYLSVLDNILIPTLTVKDEDKKTYALELIKKFNLEHRINHLPSELSIGERQRTALARALINKPNLILADEPTGNLDDENAKLVLNHLKEFAEEGNKVLMVTHSKDAAVFADKIINL